jgi:hypothetical protein
MTGLGSERRCPAHGGRARLPHPPGGRAACGTGQDMTHLERVDDVRRPLCPWVVQIGDLRAEERLGPVRCGRRPMVQQRGSVKADQVWGVPGDSPGLHRRWEVGGGRCR